MALTNAIIDHGNFAIKDTEAQDWRTDKFFTYHATLELLKMMAPITPAFAEECWCLASPFRPGALTVALANIVNRFRPRTMVYPEADQRGMSIFDQPFPTTDGTFEMLAPSTQTCAVQVNGRLRLVVEIPAVPADLKAEELEKWIVDTIMATEEGKQRLLGGQEKGNHVPDIRKAKKVIIVKGGKTVNFVV